MTLDEAKYWIESCVQSYTSDCGLEADTIYEARDLIFNMVETAQLIETKTGHWVDHGTYVDCSNCGCLAPSTEVADGVIWKRSNYCPDCGAKMEVEG